jgi:aryl-alcohol dehydrogenase-like predicted oxidoreductase
MTITIPAVRLGADGPIVGAQGLGCMGMTDYYGEPDLEGSRAVLDAALDAGVTLFDTAASYSRGRNEAFLAPFVQRHRDAITIATKFGLRTRDDGPTEVINDPNHIRASVDESLARLGIETIDLYYMHRRDPGVPLADSIGTLAELVAAGKVRWIGLSEVSGDELREAHAIHPITAVEQEWSLFDRALEDTLVPAASALGVGLVPYSPLGRGFLAGAFTDADALGDDVRAWYPRYRGEHGRANLALLEPIRAVAAAHDATLAQVALAWLQHQAERHGTAVVPIPGTKKVSRLEENLGATRLTLTADELAALEPIAARVSGSRHASTGGAPESPKD